MTPTYLNSTPTCVPIEQLNLAQQDQGGLLQQGDSYVSRHESSDRILPSTHAPEQSAGKYSLEMSNFKQEKEGRSGNILLVKCSKMRLMKKMMNKDQTVLDKQMQTTSSTLDSNNSSNNSSSDNNIFRSCSDCNTTKTPLWRSGPRGPKSLCNACGIRQRKARRRAMAAALVASEPSSSTKLCVKAKGCKITRRRRQKKLCFEDVVLSLSKSSAYCHKVFPQDEKEAAILLMALSCGLANG